LSKASRASGATASWASSNSASRASSSRETARAYFRAGHDRDRTLAQRPNQAARAVRGGQALPAVAEQARHEARRSHDLRALDVLGQQ
jgi:hypothetical protein